jgi:hypothetical protein
MEAIEFASEKGLRGPRVFDCLLAVTARRNQVDRIWTDNISDLKHFDDLFLLPWKTLWKWDGRFQATTMRLEEISQREKKGFSRVFNPGKQHR